MILKQTSHQAELFQACGFKVDIFTHYAHQPTLINPAERYINRIIFFGSLSNRHIRRKLLIEELIEEVYLSMFVVAHEQVHSKHTIYMQRH